MHLRGNTKLNILYLNNEMTIGGVAKCILKLSKELCVDHGVFIASKDNGALLDEFEVLGIKNYPLLDVQSKIPHKVAINVIRVIKIVKEQKIDIIHSHHRMTTLIAKIVSIFLGVKVIHTQHAILSDKKKLTKIILKNIPIFAVSNAVKDNLIYECKIKASNIYVVYNAIDNTKYNFKIEDKIINYKRNDYFLIGCISRITKNKGIDVLIESAKILHSKNKKVKFFIIGDGDEKTYLEGYCRKCNLDNIEFIGFRKNVMDYIDYFDLVVQPSFREGLGLTAIEAISRSRTVVASNIPGLNEVIINNYNGMLFPCGDYIKLTSIIENLYLDRNKLNIISKNGFEHYVENFDLSKYLNKHLYFYKSLTNKN